MQASLKTARRSRKLLATSEQLALCAWQLFDTVGYEAATMEAIAEAADVARGTLYRHFSVKEAFIAYRFKQDQHQHKDAVIAGAMSHASTHGAFCFALGLEAGYAAKMRDYLEPFLLHRMAQQTSAANIAGDDLFFALSITLIERGQANGELRPAMNATVLAEYFSFLRLATMMRWLAHPQEDLMNLYVQMLDFFLYGAVQGSDSQGRGQ